MKNILTSCNNVGWEGFHCVCVCVCVCQNVVLETPIVAGTTAEVTLECFVSHLYFCPCVRLRSRSFVAFNCDQNEGRV